MSKRDWAANFQKFLKPEREAHEQKIAALRDVHRDPSNKSWDAFGVACELYDRAKAALDEFMREYLGFLKSVSAG